MPHTHARCARDAERNRQRILDAARASCSPSAGWASRSTRSPATPASASAPSTAASRTRSELIDALFEERIGAARRRRRGRLALTDPRDGLRAFLAGVHEHVAADRTLRTLVIAAEGDRFEEIRARMQPIAGRLLRRAQRAGVVRRDVRVTDLPVMTMMVGAAADATRAVRPDAWRRFSALLLDALLVDPDARRPLPVAPLDQAALAALRVGTD